MEKLIGKSMSSVVLSSFMYERSRCSKGLDDGRLDVHKPRELNTTSMKRPPQPN